MFGSKQRSTRFNLEATIILKKKKFLSPKKRSQFFTDSLWNFKESSAWGRCLVDLCDKKKRNFNGCWIYLFLNNFSFALVNCVQEKCLFEWFFFFVSKVNLYQKYFVRKIPWRSRGVKIFCKFFSSWNMDFLPNRHPSSKKKCQGQGREKMQLKRWNLLRKLSVKEKKSLYRRWEREREKMWVWVMRVHLWDSVQL